MHVIIRVSTMIHCGLITDNMRTFTKSEMKNDYSLLHSLNAIFN